MKIVNNKKLDMKVWQRKHLLVCESGWVTGIRKRRNCATGICVYQQYIFPFSQKLTLQFLKKYSANICKSFVYAFFIFPYVIKMDKTSFTLVGPTVTRLVPAVLLLNNQLCMYANPVFWVPASWGKVLGVLRPLPNS